MPSSPSNVSLPFKVFRPGASILQHFSSLLAATNLCIHPANRQPRAGSSLSGMDDCLGECIGRVFFECVWALTAVTIGNHIARHQNLIMRRVLELQDLFRLPKCVRILSEDDHEIPEQDIKTCAVFLAICSIISALVVMAALVGLSGTAPGWSWRWCAMSLGLILLLAAVNSPIWILLWIILAVSARGRASHRRRRAGMAARPCQEAKAEEGMTKSAGDGAATALATSPSTPERQSLRWNTGEISLPFI